MASDAPAAAGASSPTGVLPSTMQPDSALLDLPEDLQFQLQMFKRQLSELQQALLSATAHVSSPAELAAVSEPTQQARLCLALAKVVNSLHHVYMRAHGRDPFAPATAGGVAVGRQELDRIRQYDKKVSRAVHDAEVRASRPVLSLNVAAASRFIDAAIPDLTEQQRADLKRAAQAVEAKRGVKKARGSAQPTATPTEPAGTSQQQAGKRSEAANKEGAERNQKRSKSTKGKNGGDGDDGSGKGVSSGREAAEQFLAAFAAADGTS